VAVLAHAGKSVGGGLPQLRETLASYGIDDPRWVEVKKSKHAPKKARALLEDGTDLLFVWGGDGTVQRVIDAVAGRPVTLAIVPAGTANLLATNLGIPADVPEAVRIGLHGDRRALDVGKMNGEHFAVMAGAGLDALMIERADGAMKDRLGRLAYVWTGARGMRDLRSVRMTIEVDRHPWFDGKATCVLVGNVGKAFAGLDLFPDAAPDDGRLDIGVVTARGMAEWSRTLGRAVVGDVLRSPFVEATTGHRFRIDLREELPYELDGGDRDRTARLKVKVKPGAIRVCVPGEATA
ncbi:MAG TPA: diacylglycerol kinase family protein, partial [Actinomycetota bacterium]